MNEIYNVLKDLIVTYRWHEYIEIEVKFGWFDSFNNTFNSNIHENHFNILSKKFSTFDGFLKQYSDVTDYITKHGIRISVDKDNKVLQIIRKVKLKNVTIKLHGTPYDIRITVSQEIPCTCNDNKYIYSRHKIRNTFKYKMWNYDLTKVTIPMHCFYDKFNDSNEHYEFEIELNNINSTFDNDYLANSLSLKINDIINISNEKIHLKKVEFIK